MADSDRTRQNKRKPNEDNECTLTEEHTAVWTRDSHSKNKPVAWVSEPWHKTRTEPETRQEWQDPNTTLQHETEHVDKRAVRLEHTWGRALTRKQDKKGVSGLCNDFKSHQKLVSTTLISSYTIINIYIYIYLQLSSIISCFHVKYVNKQKVYRLNKEKDIWYKMVHAVTR